MRSSWLFAILCIATMPVRADILIDDFNTGPFSADLVPLFPQALVSDTEAGSMLGGTRETIFGLGLIGASAPAGHLQIAPGLSASAPSGASLLVESIYTPPGADLTKEDRFLLHFKASSGPLQLAIAVFSPDGISASPDIIVPASSVPFSFEVPFSAIPTFGNNPGFDLPADFADVTQITFALTGNFAGNGQSFELAAIRAVPEPATWTSLVLGALCAGVVAMRRRSHPICARAAVVSCTKHGCRRLQPPIMSTGCCPPVPRAALTDQRPAARRAAGACGRRVVL